jgi:hypothetical protein
MSRPRPGGAIDLNPRFPQGVDPCAFSGGRPGIYRTGDAETDRRNRAFLDCLNAFIAGAGQREHCREMEDFISRFSADAEQRLADRHEHVNLGAELGRRLLASMPLEA